MYEELKNKILSRFSETVDTTEYYQKPAGYGYFGYVPYEHDTMRIKRKVAGLFDFEFCYSNTNPYRDQFEVTFTEGDVDYSGRAGAENTVKMIGCAYEYEEEHLIADIMIASALYDFYYMIKDMRIEDTIAYNNLKQIKNMAKKAVEVLKENNYKEWNHNTKHFVFRGGNYTYSRTEFLRLISGKEFQVEDYCNLIFDIFKWFFNKNNYTTLAYLNPKGYEFAHFEVRVELFTKEFIQYTAHLKAKSITEICSNYMKELDNRYEAKLKSLQEPDDYEIPEYVKRARKSDKVDKITELMAKQYKEMMEKQKKLHELWKPEIELEAKALSKKIEELREKEISEIFMEWVNDEQTIYHSDFRSYEYYKQTADEEWEYMKKRFPKRYNNLQLLLQKDFEIISEFKKGNLFSIRDDLLSY